MSGIIAAAEFAGPMLMGESDDGGGGGDSSMGASEVAGFAESAGGGLDSLLNPIMSIAGVVNSAQQQEQAQKNFDRTFEENKRRFGLEFALKEWATRKRMELNEAQALYQRQMGSANLQMNRAAMRENLKAGGLNRFQQERQMSWDREDREKSKKMAESYSSGLLKGLGGK
jgi:hypothetical protein